MTTQAADFARDEEAAFRVIIEGVPAMLWLGDDQGHCVFLNRELRDFWGVAADAVATFDWTSTLHPDDAADLAGPYAEAMRRQSSLEVEARYRRADGAWRILRTTARPRFSLAGRFLGMIGVNTDMTELRQSEAALRRSSQHLEFALEAAGGIGTWVWDVQGDRVVTDSRFATTFGIDPAAAEAGTPVQDFLNAVSAEDRDRVANEIRDALEGGDRFQTEFRLTADAGVRWFLAIGRCERDEAGLPSLFPGVVVDITERKAREDAQALLTRELSHRIKNILAVSGALTGMVARSHPDARPALSELQDRFRALAAAYDCVVPSPERSGAAASDLHGLLDLLFAPYRSEGADRVAINCPEIAVPPDTASMLALILHELGTNSSKYGALSGTGIVHLSVTAGDGALDLDWREDGGPEVTPSADQGFGSTLIAQSAASLGAEIRAEWKRSGLHWTM